jgi:hypothetical protein
VCDYDVILQCFAQATPLGQVGQVGVGTTHVALRLFPAFANARAQHQVAVGATHVAFSSVRLEPTWMLLGGAAGALSALAIRTSVIPANVPVLALQQRVTSMQPIVFYSDSDANNTSKYSTSSQLLSSAMQILGPWGVASDDDDGATARTLAAEPNGTLSRAAAAHWLIGARLARNSTVGNTQERGPLPRKVQRWADYGPGDAFYTDAVLCATHGAFPMPDTESSFHPRDPVIRADLVAWADKVLGRASSSTRHRTDCRSRQHTGHSPDRPSVKTTTTREVSAGKFDSTSRADAAALIYERVAPTHVIC